MGYQGKVVVDEADGGGFMVMTPDGAVAFCSTRAKVAVLAAQWFADNLNGAAAGIGKIEWPAPAPQSGRCPDCNGLGGGLSGTGRWRECKTCGGSCLAPVKP